MRSAIILLILALSFMAQAQTPFSTYKSPATQITPKQAARAADSDLRSLKIRTRSNDPADFVAELKKINQQSKDSFSLEYFDHLSANAVFIQNSQKMFPTINGEIMNYKLGVWTQKIYIQAPSVCDTCDNIADRHRRRACHADRRKCKESLVDTFRTHYLPFSIITKVSGNYVDSSAGPTHDATSFFGAPLTLRFAPAADLTPNMIDNKLFIGINADLRLLTIADTNSNQLQTSWGAYISAGFSYLGKGFAFDTDEADRHDGKFSASAMLYWFKSGGEFNKAIFGDYEKKTLTGIELILRFKTSSKEDSKFNFIFGANNGFRRGAPNFAKWQFQLGIGT